MEAFTLPRIPIQNEMLVHGPSYRLGPPVCGTCDADIPIPSSQGRRLDLEDEPDIYCVTK